MSKRSKGIVSGGASYVIWGLLGIFWSLLSSIPATDILAYRIVFSLLIMAVILTVQKDWRAFSSSVIQLCKNGKILWVILSAFLISVNWGTYIYMVSHGQATEASLGYYIMPLLNVIVAVVFFKERLNRYSLIAILLAGFGVALFAIQAGSLPINTMIVAFAFCFYGVLKKQIPLPSTFSLTLETVVSVPFALIYLWLGSDSSFLSLDPKMMILLAISGVVTVIPLLLFTIAAKNLDFLTLSFIQYVNPTMQLLVAIFWLHEAFDWHKLIVFGLIWTGVIIFTIGSLNSYKKIAQEQQKQLEKSGE